MRKIITLVQLSIMLLCVGYSLGFSQFTTNGGASSLGGNCYRLTPNITNVRGSIWNTQTINLNNPFDITFHYTAIPNGADGAAFVLQTSGTNALGGAGSGLGYGQPIALSPSLAVELDLWDNSGAGVDDISQDHIAIHGNGNMAATLAGPVAALSTGGNITDGICRELRVTWSPGTNNLDVYFDGALKLSYANNIRTSIFSSNPNVYFGFTGATGGVGCEQTVCYEFASAGADTGICLGGTYQLGASGGTAYTWSPGFFLNSTSIADPVFSPPPVVGVAAYQVSVDNSFGCTDVDSINISVESPPAANAGSGGTICSGDSIQVGTALVAGRTYSWSPTNGLSDPNVAQPMASPGSNTTYTLTVTDVTGFANCTATSQVTVNVNSSPTAQAGTPTTICVGQCASLGVPPLPAHTYTWSPATGLNSATSSAPTACPTVTTTYTVTLDNGNCTDTDTVTVTIAPLPTADAGAVQTVCSGACATIGSAAITGNTYSWSPAIGLSSASIAQPSACPTTTTQYNVSVTNTSNGCMAEDSVVVTVNPTPLADAGPDTNACAGGCVGIGMPSAAGVNYAWTPSTGLSSASAANPTACPTGPTTYFLTATDAVSNCQSLDSVMVDVVPLPTANAGTDQGFCSGDSVQLGSAGQPGYTYNWVPTFGLSDPTAADPMASPAGTVGYIFTVTETASGCSKNDSVTITLNNSPVAGFSFTTSNQTATFTNTSAGSSAYSWTFGDGNSDTTSAPTHTYSSDGTYIVCLTASTSNGCTDSICKTVVIQTTGFEEVNFEKLELYPNPANDHFSLSWNDLKIGRGSVLVTDMAGKLLWRKDSLDLIGDGVLEVKVEWPKGTYFVLINGENRRMVKKLLVR